MGTLSIKNIKTSSIYETTGCCNTDRTLISIKVTVNFKCDNGIVVFFPKKHNL